MLNKIFSSSFLKSSYLIKNFNFIKIANFSRKLTSNQDKKLEKIENINKNNSKNDLKLSKSEFSSLNNYIDLDKIKDLNDKNLNRNKKPSKTKEVAKNDLEEHLKDKNINIIKEEVVVKIKPYFPNAVDEKEKSHLHIDSEKIQEVIMSTKKDTRVKDLNSIQTLKNKRMDKKKIAAAKKASLFMQSMKREIPEEL